MASSVDLLVRYVNWCGARAGGRWVLMSPRTSFSKHLVMTALYLEADKSRKSDPSAVQ